MADMPTNPNIQHPYEDQEYQKNREASLGHYSQKVMFFKRHQPQFRGDILRSDHEPQ